MVFMPQTITSIGEGAFFECENLNSFVIPDSVENIGTGALGCLYDEESEQVYTKEKFDIYGYDNNVAEKYAGEYGFNYRDSSELIHYSSYNGNAYVEWADKRIHKADIPAYVDGKPVTNIGTGGYAFEDCIYLESVTLPDTVRTIGTNAFSNTAVSEIVLPENVTDIDLNAFGNCIFLEKVNIPSGVTKISDSVFKNCFSLENIDLSENITEIGSYAFNGCISLKEISIPSSVKNIKDYVFTNCYSLERINVSEENNFYYDEDGVLFREIKWAGGNVTRNLVEYPAARANETYTMPDGIQIIVKGAFSGCCSLRKVTVSGNVERIEFNAFSDSESLESVIIPKSAWSIDENFEDCPALTVYMETQDMVNKYMDNYAEEGFDNFKVSQANESLKGDFNGDGAVTATDLVAFKKYILNVSSDSVISKENADLNQDGDINVIDFVMLKSVILQ